MEITKKPIIVSVVTVTRNASDLLKRTIENIDAQTYGNLEYIVVDGASSDDSVEILSSSNRIDKWVSEPDKGIYDAMNKGVGMAHGEWIIFMNAGDTFANDNSIESLIKTAIDNPECDVIYGDVVRTDGIQGHDVLKPASEKLKRHRLAFCHQSVMCRRKHLLRFPFDITHKYSSDFKFFKTLQNQGVRFKHTSLPIAKFDTSGISSRNRSKGLADNMRVIWEVDGPFKGMLPILHLLPTYIISYLRGK